MYTSTNNVLGSAGAYSHNNLPIYWHVTGYVVKPGHVYHTCGRSGKRVVSALFPFGPRVVLVLFPFCQVVLAWVVSGPLLKPCIAPHWGKIKHRTAEGFRTIPNFQALPQQTINFFLLSAENILIVQKRLFIRHVNVFDVYIQLLYVLP